MTDDWPQIKARLAESKLATQGVAQAEGQVSKASKRKAAIRRREQSAQRTQALSQLRLSYATEDVFAKLANGADPVRLLEMLQKGSPGVIR